jgi:uncharacterized protein (DUF2147 family)
MIRQNIMKHVTTKTQPSPQQATHQLWQSARPRGLPVARTLWVVVACSFLVSCGKQANTTPASSSPGSSLTNNGSPALATKPELAKLLGKWQRADGDYVIEIKSIDADGKMDLSYFNPDPIHVSKAVTMKQDGVTKVFIELRDTNYPGCTYGLIYDPADDQLYGQYYQAALQQTYDVAFARTK